MKYRPQFRIGNMKLSDTNIRDINKLNLKDLNIQDAHISESFNLNRSREKDSESNQIKKNGFVISKADSTLFHIKNYVGWKLKNGKLIDPLMLGELIKQWEYDYEMDREFQPEMLVDMKQIEKYNEEFYEKIGG